MCKKKEKDLLVNYDKHMYLVAYLMLFVDCNLV